MLLTSSASHVPFYCASVLTCCPPVKSHVHILVVSWLVQTDLFTISSVIVSTV